MSTVERIGRARTVWLVLAGLVLAAVGARLWAAGQIPTPWIMVDELIYSELAKSLAESGTLRVRDQPSAFYSLLYPLLIAPGWWASRMATTYEIAKAVNVVVMSLAAVPIFLWARRLVSQRLALVAAGLVLLMPSFLYTGTLMTENAFLPAFVLAAFATAVALERPTRWTQGLALVAIAIATAVRLQGLVLFAVYATAVVIKLVLDRRAGERVSLRPYWFSGLALAVVGGLILGTTVARGDPLVANLGAYQSAVGAGYSVGDVGRWTLYHAAELGLSVAFVPLSAFLALLVLAWRPGAGAAERAFLAVTTAAIPWIVVSVSVFASRNSGRVEERYTFYLAPLLLLALVVWLERGRPRTLLAGVAGVVPLALAATLPLGKLVNVNIFADTFAFHPLYWLEQEGRLEDGEIRALVLGVAALAALLFALVPLHPARLVLPALVGCVFIATQIAVFDVVRTYSETLDDVARMGDPSWLDRRFGRDASVAFLWTGAFNPHILWQTEFWNRNLDTVYRLAPELGNLPAAETLIDAPTGRLGDRAGLSRARRAAERPGNHVLPSAAADVPERPRRLSRRPVHADRRCDRGNLRRLVERRGVSLHALRLRPGGLARTRSGERSSTRTAAPGRPRATGRPTGRPRLGRCRRGALSADSGARRPAARAPSMSRSRPRPFRPTSSPAPRTRATSGFASTRQRTFPVEPHR